MRGNAQGGIKINKRGKEKVNLKGKEMVRVGVNIM